MRSGMQASQRLGKILRRVDNPHDADRIGRRVVDDQQRERRQRPEPEAQPGLPRLDPAQERTGAYPPCGYVNELPKATSCLWLFSVRIPTESGQQFQLKAAIDSNGRRPLIPIEPGHP